MPTVLVTPAVLVAELNLVARAQAAVAGAFDGGKVDPYIVGKTGAFDRPPTLLSPVELHSAPDHRVNCGRIHPPILTSSKIEGSRNGSASDNIRTFATSAESA
jgi:hypothetical protein